MSDFIEVLDNLDKALENAENNMKEWQKLQLKRTGMILPLIV